MVVIDQTFATVHTSRLLKFFFFGLVRTCFSDYSLLNNVLLLKVRKGYREIVFTQFRLPFAIGGFYLEQ